MISKKDLIESEVQNVLQNSEEYSFSAMLILLREAYTLSLKTVSTDLNVPYNKYYFWENGNFYNHRWPTDDQLNDIAGYYDIPPTLIRKKILEMK